MDQLVAGSNPVNNPARSAPRRILFKTIYTDPPHTLGSGGAKLMVNTTQKYSQVRWGYSLLSSFADTLLVRQQLKQSDTLNNYVLAHYSSSRKGSAYYYQQLKYSRVLKSRHSLEYYQTPGLLRSILFTKYAPQVSRRFASVSSIFTAYYYFLTGNRQVRSSRVTLAHNKSGPTYFLGTASSGTLGNSTFAKTRYGLAIRGGHHHTFYR